VVYDGDGDLDLLLRKSDNSQWRFFNIENLPSVSNGAHPILQNINLEVQDARFRNSSDDERNSLWPTIAVAGSSS
jgi:hypothetical protein